MKKVQNFRPEPFVSKLDAECKSSASFLSTVTGFDRIGAKSLLYCIGRKDVCGAMMFSTEKSGDKLRISLRGEIDHHNAAEVRVRIDRVLETEMPEVFYFNLSGVTFCDSSGLGLVMGRMRKCGQIDSVLIVESPSEAVLKILNIAGMDKLIRIERSNGNGKAS